MKAKASELALKLKIKIFEDINYDVSVRGFMKTDVAPIILFEKGELVIKNAAFSLCPTWSKEYPCKFSTYNARLERENPKTGAQEFIFQVPTWKDSFNNGKTCLVPMQAASESSYFGTHAGKMVRFSTKKDEIFFVVGLYSEWLDKKTGEVKETFTLLTDDPYQFFFDTGHDRSVIIIKDSKMEEWLKNQKMKPQERFNFIRDNRISLDWKAETEREMKAGWEKKAPTKDEIKQIKVWSA